MVYQGDGIWRFEWQQRILGEAQAGSFSAKLIKSSQKKPQNQKLEQEKRKNKGLSLDPHRRNHFQLYQNQNQEDEEQEQENLKDPQTASFQELFHQNQLLYAEPPPPPLPKKRSYFPSSSLGPASDEHAIQMRGDTSYQNPSPSRLGLKNNNAAAGGEIVEVQGGHIVRSTGRKDRHSKVCTAKGPRDRRVRLAAHTAIQFYDVQDRLGYDRPSKAVDWLIKKAKAAIDELAELPAWHPTASTPNAAAASFQPENPPKNTDHENQHHVISDVSASSGKRAMAMMFGGGNEQISSFLPPSLDSDAIADTIKSFFPMAAAGEPSSSAMQFHNFSTHDGNNNNNSSQDLRLSLQSFQDPIFHHHNPPPPPHSNPSHHHEQARAQGQQQHVLLSGTPLGFDGWPPPPEHLQRFPPWNSGGDTTASAAGFIFNSPQPQQQQQLYNQYLTSSSQRGPLQSSNTPSLRAWMDPSSISTADHHHHHHPGASLPLYSGYASSGYGGFSGFHIPARIQGDEEEHDGYSDKPSSASSDSRH